ncbi:5-deoxy-glucuronate isomerase [Janibacter limosus]|uniref:5-deoxy-glucuronate isomerase n=1 Tax=Janibacter limosus TaxID=53458 RepID=UPI0035D56998|nr:5-deoxy-glucuronate isomerase [Janibacter limosus]
MNHTPRTGADNERWFHPFAPEGGSRAVEITDAVEGWQHTSLRVAVLEPDARVAHTLSGEEAIVVPLTGGTTVTVGGSEHVLTGRTSVFAGPSDTLYAPAGSDLELANHGASTTRIALCGARVEDPTGGGREVVVVPAARVPVELRGAGSCSREVRGFGMPDTLPGAEQILACEVITPAGGWSSYPPHKHDTDRPGQESELEEIYYFETQSVGDAGAGRAPLTRGTDGEDGRQPVGYQQVYGAEGRDIDVLVEVATGDTVPVPHGWHGPAMAAPDADLYYLNVMAGPGPERARLICDDPAHGQIRASWTGEGQ